MLVQIIRFKCGLVFTCLLGQMMLFAVPVYAGVEGKSYNVNVRDFQKINYSTNKNNNHFQGGMKGLPTAAPSFPFCSNLNNDACF
jgi:hypothetical protein